MNSLVQMFSGKFSKTRVHLSWHFVTRNPTASNSFRMSFSGPAVSDHKMNLLWFVVQLSREMPSSDSLCGNRTKASRADAHRMPHPRNGNAHSALLGLPATLSGLRQRGNAAWLEFGQVLQDVLLQATATLALDLKGQQQRRQANPQKSGMGVPGVECTSCSVRGECWGYYKPSPAEAWMAKSPRMRLTGLEWLVLSHDRFLSNHYNDSP